MKALILVFLAFSSALYADPGIQTRAKAPVTKNGKATYYASKFHGRRTSSGEVFSNKKFTAAHLKLPFGTKVTVVNTDNGKSVEVRVNDRGPHSKFYMIDLSQAAAKKIGIFGKGVGNVEISYYLPGEEPIKVEFPPVGDSPIPAP